MYSVGTVIYFTPFYFESGNSAKPKYFVVLGVEGDAIITANLPTRKNKVPKSITLSHGCLDDGKFNCYHFTVGQSICTNGFSFDMPTFMYGYYVSDFNRTVFDDIYKKEGTDFEIIGQLTNEETIDILKCFSKSKSLPRKYVPKFKKLLEVLTIIKSPSKTDSPEIKKIV